MGKRFAFIIPLNNNDLGDLKARRRGWSDRGGTKRGLPSSVELFMDEQMEYLDTGTSRGLDNVGDDQRAATTSSSQRGYQTHTPTTSSIQETGRLPGHSRELSTGSYTAVNVNLAAIEADYAANYNIDLMRVTAVRFRNRKDSAEIDAVFLINDGESSSADRISFQEQVELEGYFRKRKEIRRQSLRNVVEESSIEARMFRQESETSKLKERVDKLYYSPGMPGAIEAQENFRKAAERKQDRNESPRKRSAES